jgi:hypothetical protein
MWIFLGRILPVSAVNTSILWRVDNTTALAYLREEGGLGGRRLLWEAARMLPLLRSCRLRFLPAFIPSEVNLQDDAASRFRPVPVWLLVSNVVSQMVSLWGTPQIDLFASRQSAQCRRLMSWRAADEPEAVDALSVVWDFRLVFLFPPIPPFGGGGEAGGVEGGVPPRLSSLGSPDVVRQSSSPSSVGSPPPPFPRVSRGRPRHGGSPSIPGTTFSSRLKDMRGFWGVDAISDRSFRLIAAGWFRSSEDRFERAWRSF